MSLFPLLQSIVADMRHDIMDKLTTVNSQDSLPVLSGEVAIEDANHDNPYYHKPLNCQISDRGHEFEEDAYYP